MSSDLPSMHRSSYAMARALASYIDDPVRVQQAVHDQWGRSPCLQTIADMRASHMRKTPQESISTERAYNAAWEAEKLDYINARFVQALERERSLSVDVARASGALKSPLLTNRPAVDAAYEREVERARGSNP